MSGDSYSVRPASASGASLSASSLAVYNVAKRAVRTVARANVASLSGTTTINGVALAAGDRVLLTAQSTGSQNGPWLVNASTWTRPTDFDSNTNSSAILGATYLVGEGYFAGTTYRLATTGSITIDTTSLSFVAVGEVRWQRVIELADVTNKGAVTTGDFELFTIPANTLITDRFFFVETAAGGPATVTANLGYTSGSGYNDYLSGVSIKSTVENFASGPYEDTARTVYLRVITLGDDLEDVTGLNDGILLNFSWREDG